MERVLIAHHTAMAAARNLLFVARTRITHLSLNARFHDTPSNLLLILLKMLQFLVLAASPAKKCRNWII